MENHINTTKWQTTILVVLRFLIGWHILYEGLFKLMHPEWSSLAFLSQSQWILSGFASWLTSTEHMLGVVDFLNKWGLIAIGLGLMLGLFTRIAALAGFILLMLYYFMNPPLIGLGPTGAMEGNYLVVNKTLIEAVTLLLFALFPGARLYGIDSILKHNRNKKQ